MYDKGKLKQHFLMPGALFVKDDDYAITTVLGSCIAICIWDKSLLKGGMNHYKLPLWNGDGLPTPKYGNIAINVLVEKMLAMGCKRKNLTAKVFGGGAVLKGNAGVMNVGERNIEVAWDILKVEKIPVVASSVGGEESRKIIFSTRDGSVMMKKSQNST
ncbi:MAG: chemotaxis protein CheD [Magnetococcales bacterium]|nr:chemotaxis protein CheD [Magnetococcales bacterium]